MQTLILLTDWFPDPQISSFLGWKFCDLDSILEGAIPYFMLPLAWDAPNIQTKQKMLPECRSTMSLCHLDVIGHFSGSFSLVQNFQIHVLSFKRVILLIGALSFLFPFRYVRSLFSPYTCSPKWFQVHPWTMPSENQFQGFSLHIAFLCYGLLPRESLLLTSCLTLSPSSIPLLNQNPCRTFWFSRAYHFLPQFRITQLCS